MEDYLGRPPWAFAKVEPIVARIRFDSHVAWMVKQTQVTGDKWTDEPDGGGLLERNATDLEALMKWVLRFGAHAEVLGPKELRQKVIDSLRSVRALYTKDKRRRNHG